MDAGRGNAVSEIHGWVRGEFNTGIDTGGQTEEKRPRRAGWYSLYNPGKEAQRIVKKPGRDQKVLSEEWGKRRIEGRTD